MAGIFNLFSDISETNKGHIANPLSRPNSLVVPSGPLKSMGTPKSKGLSIRSNSDLNIPCTPRINNNIKQNSSSAKDKDCSKLKLTQLDTKGRPLSPGRELLKKKKEVIESKKPKLQKLSNDHCFKQPLPPKKHTKSYGFPEPEELAPYSDLQFEFENVYTKDLEGEFQELLIQKRKLIKPFEDEGFVSDPEPLPSPKIAPLSTATYFLDTLHLEDDTVDLPDLAMDDTIDELLSA